MFKPLMKFPVMLTILLLLHFCTQSQNLVADSSSEGYKNAIAFYNQSLSEELHLFNGRLDKGYPYSFEEGTPYFLTNSWSRGTVNYEGKKYENVSLLYDVTLDELVYLYFDKVSRIRLIKEKVSEFSLMDHSFIHLATGSLHGASLAPGFYDRLYYGKVSLLARRTKHIETTFRHSGAERKVYNKNQYFLQKGDEYLSIRNKRSFLSSLSDKRKELQQYMRQNKLNFRKETEKTITKTLAYYNELINKQ
jgi:hypothetical protein